MPSPDAGVSQLPPTTRTDLEGWLTAGAYRQWRCEPAAHAQRSPSPHSNNRICSNDAVSMQGPTGEFPVGAASVQELYDSASATVVGYTVMRHVSAGTSPDSWYFYARVPAASSFVRDADGLAANGPGSSSGAMQNCVACHQGAGTGGYSGHDYVFTQVR